MSRAFAAGDVQRLATQFATRDGFAQWAIDYANITSFTHAQVSEIYDIVKTGSIFSVPNDGEVVEGSLYERPIWYHRWRGSIHETAHILIFHNMVRHPPGLVRRSVGFRLCLRSTETNVARFLRTLHLTRVCPMALAAVLEQIMICHLG